MLCQVVSGLRFNESVGEERGDGFFRLLECDADLWCSLAKCFDDAFQHQLEVMNACASTSMQTPFFRIDGARLAIYLQQT